MPEAASISTIEKYVMENYPAEFVKIINSISVDLPKAKSVRINITMPDDILTRLDAAVSGQKECEKPLYCRCSRSTSECDSLSSTVK